LMISFPTVFSGLGLQLSWSFFLQSVSLIGGINLNWLPLLFLQLAILFPLLVVLLKKKKELFWAYCIAAFFTTVGFTVWQFPYRYYREVMWIPWSLFLVLPWYFYEREKEKSSVLFYGVLSLAGAVCFAVLYTVWIHLGRSVTLIDNKYPPNFFYISYEVFGSFLLLAVGSLPFLHRRRVSAVYGFISKTSYGLFFIHYIVMDFVLSINKLWGYHIGVWYQVCAVVGISIGIAWIFSSTEVFRKHLFLQAHNLFFTPSSH